MDEPRQRCSRNGDSVNRSAEDVRRVDVLPRRRAPDRLRARVHDDRRRAQGREAARVRERPPEDGRRTGGRRAEDRRRSRPQVPFRQAARAKDPTPAHGRVHARQDADQGVRHRDARYRVHEATASLAYR